MYTMTLTTYTEAELDVMSFQRISNTLKLVNKTWTKDDSYFNYIINDKEAKQLNKYVKILAKVHTKKRPYEELALHCLEWHLLEKELQAVSNGAAYYKKILIGAEFVKTRVASDRINYIDVVQQAYDLEFWKIRQLLKVL